MIEIGLTESIVAAAASRVGKTVLQIDANDYYGGQWASFNLESIQSFGSANASTECVIENAECRWTPESITPTLPESVAGDSETIATDVAIDAGEKVAGDATEEAPEEAKTIVETAVWTKSKILSEFRKFNIDITPKVFESHEMCLRRILIKTTLLVAVRSW